MVYFSEIECDWNNELLLINEDIRHIQRDHVIIFFEIVDILGNLIIALLEKLLFENDGQFGEFLFSFSLYSLC